jgi:Zinc knuckle.
VKVQTTDEIIVKDRFGENTEFERRYGSIVWKCSIRGGKNHSFLRLLNVPEDLCNEAIKAAIRAFARPLSNIEEEVFGSYSDPRLIGIINGNRKVLIEPLSTIPEFIEIASRRIRVIHKDQIKRCFRCKEEGHFKYDCTANVKDVESTISVIHGESVPEGSKQDQLNADGPTDLIGTGRCPPVEGGSSNSEKLRLTKEASRTNRLSGNGFIEDKNDAVPSESSTHFDIQEQEPDHDNPIEISFPSTGNDRILRSKSERKEAYDEQLLTADMRDESGKRKDMTTQRDKAIVTKSRTQTVSKGKK